MAPPPSSESAFLQTLPSIPRDAAPSRLFKRLDKVGQGAYGSVYKAEHPPTAFVLALKVIDLDTQDDDTAEIQHEVGMLQSMTKNGDADRNNVSRYFGCWMEGPKVWIAMDYADGGSLRTLRKAGPIEEKFIVLITREVLTALSFLNRMGIIHRDIKAANILLNSQPRVTLCDFGVSAPLFLSSSASSKRTTFIGTPYWMAPEVILGQPYDTKADIWGLGITVLEVADENGEPPLAKEDAMRAIMMIPKQKPPRLPDGGGWSKEMREFIAGCLNEKPDERLSADDLVKTKWVKASAKQPLAPLKELLRRMDVWRERGNKRTSLVMSMYGDGGDKVSEFGLDGNPDDSWHFNTFRPGEKGGPSSEFPTPATSTPVTAPRSLRHLFEDANAPAPTIDPFRAGPSNGGLSPSPSGLLSAVARYDDDTPESRTSTIRPSAFGSSGLPAGTFSEGHGGGGGTRRPHQRQRSNTSTSSAGRPPATLIEGFSSSPAGSTATYRDVRTSKGLPTITIPTASSFSVPDPSSDSPGGAASSPVTSTSRPRHKPSDSIDSISSSTSSSPRIQNRKFQMPLEPPSFPPAMLRSGSESPLRGLPGTRRPSIARQASIAVMETAVNAPAVPSPVPRPAVSRNNTALVTTGATVTGTRQRSMSRGEQTEGFDRSGFSSPYPMPPPTPTSAMSSSGRFGATTPHLQPAGGGLKDVLKMAPMPAAGQGDLLPPSPSVHSSTANRFNFLPLPSPLSHTHSHTNLQAAAAAGAGVHASPGGASPSSYGSPSHMHHAYRPPSPPSSGHFAPHRRQPSQETYDGRPPPPRPLDYAKLVTAADVHLELERTATDLGRWLDLIDVGLGSMLLYDPPNDALSAAAAGE